MALTQKQREQREGRVTASTIGCLMTGETAKIMNLWRGLVGDPNYTETDLSGVWPVRRGQISEPLNLEWYERKTGHAVTRIGEVVIHAQYGWAAATLDGWDAQLSCPIECKDVGGNEPLTKVLARYSPQFHWQMSVTGTTELRASIIEAGREPIIEKVVYDQEYGGELWRRAKQFWRSVETLTPPVADAPATAPVRPIKTYDMTGNNQWADSAFNWLGNVDASKIAVKAEKDLKQLVPEDGERAHGYGVEITRDRANRMSLRKSK